MFLSLLGCGLLGEPGTQGHTTWNAMLGGLVRVHGGPWQGHEALEDHLSTVHVFCVLLIQT